MLSENDEVLRIVLLEKFKKTCQQESNLRVHIKIGCNKLKLTKKDAQTILNFISHKGKHDKRRKEQRMYHCPVCNTYHLTSKK